mgnify:CR=1 FL=1|jgi:hypothetical protein
MFPNLGGTDSDKASAVHAGKNAKNPNKNAFFKLIPSVLLSVLVWEI